MRYFSGTKQLPGSVSWTSLVSPKVFFPSLLLTSNSKQYCPQESLGSNVLVLVFSPTLFSTPHPEFIVLFIYFVLLCGLWGQGFGLFFSVLNDQGLIVFDAPPSVFSDILLSLNTSSQLKILEYICPVHTSPWNFDFYTCELAFAFVHLVSISNWACQKPNSWCSPRTSSPPASNIFPRKHSSWQPVYPGAQAKNMKSFSRLLTCPCTQLLIDQQILPGFTTTSDYAHCSHWSPSHHLCFFLGYYICLLTGSLLRIIQWLPFWVSVKAKAHTVNHKIHCFSESSSILAPGLPQCSQTYQFPCLQTLALPFT